MAEQLRKDVLALLRETITGYDLLEVLMFLHAHRGESWTRGGLGERIYVPLEQIGEALEQLVSHHLLIREVTPSGRLYRYATAASTLGPAVDELARLLVEQRALIMSIMSTNAIERVRSKAPSAFADAFLLRKKPENG